MVENQTGDPPRTAASTANPVEFEVTPLHRQTGSDLVVVLSPKIETSGSANATGFLELAGEWGLASSVTSQVR